MKSNAYLRFLHLSQAIQDLPGLPALDATEERILNMCADAWHQGGRVTVTGLAKIVPDVSERTSYRRIKDLHSKDMIALKSDPDDKRVKYIEPTSLCEKYFESLDRFFVDASQAKS